VKRSPDSELGAVLRHNVDLELQRLGLTTADLCERLGTTRSTYSAIYKTEKGPQLATVQRIADALGCTMQQLLMPVRETDDERA
jgi:transcriptional regulator with XRE-family HTH domain